MHPSLSNKIVLVTGSARGLGAALARAFSAQGARVIINYHSPSSAPLAAALAAELDTIAIQADVTSPEAVSSLFAQAEAHFGRPITVVVNNALGGGYSFNGDAREKLDDIPWGAFTTQMDVALRGAVNTVQAGIPGFRSAGGGRVINISSNLTTNPVVPYHDYIASKGALEAFTRSAAMELGKLGVTVNSVSAGLIRVTDASAGTPEEVWEGVARMTPLGRVVGPEDVCGVVLFLASEWARGVTGQRVGVDGGLCMG